MKGRFHNAIIYTILALFFVCLPAHAKTAAKKQVKLGPRQTKSIRPTESYSVRAGDSLYRIAKDFGTTPAALRSANRLTSDKIKAGQILSIPVPITAAVKPAPQKSTDATQTTNETYMTAAPSQSTDSGQAGIPEPTPTRLRLVQAGFEMIGLRYRFGGSGEGGG